MLQEIGTVLTSLGGLVLVVYPVAITVVLDVLILMAILKGGDGNHPFLTGMLFGFAFSRSSRSYDSGASYLGLVILAPINAGLAVMLALYLGMPLLAWIVGLVPAAALVLLGAGLLFQYFGRDIEVRAKEMATSLKEVEQSLFGYLKDRRFAMSLGAILLLSATLGSGLLFYFGLTLAAYCLGFSTIGALALLALGYLGKYVYDSQKGKLPLIQVPSYEASRYHPSVPLQPVQANYSDDRQHAIPRSSQGMSASSYSAPPSYHQANS